MTTNKVSEALVRRAPESTEALLELLFDGLEWPRPANMEIEDIPLLDWSPDELYLDPEEIARLTKIQQLPPLTAKQPFGVFILSFDGGRLPIGAVRRVVNRLVRKKRARGKSATSLWEMKDLIFFCQSSNGVGTLHVVAFQDTDNVPVMKVITWDTQATDNRIDLIANENLSALCWPDGGSLDPDAWRDQWTNAFTASYREGIRSSAALAAKMADVAKVVRDEVLALYSVETKDGPLRQLFDEVKKNLRADLTPESFADMYAQTMVYGLLTARITHPEDFEADALNSVLKFENPFLDALYSSFRRKGQQAFDVDEFGLHDLAEVLARANMDQVLADFGAAERKDDPVVFFYEEFLDRYDPAQRKELGTYYTPIPVVRFMVRAVDEIIKTEFGLPLGVADQTTWGEYSKAHDIKIPEGLKAGDQVIQMIDPATGTGTFLLEWIRRAETNLKAAGEYSPEAMKAVIEQMDAFEISLSSYAVAHLKTSLELDPSLRVHTQLGIRLTDTLAGKAPSQMSLLGDDPIAREGQQAEAVKFEQRHAVVIGNPPYLRAESESSSGVAVGGMVRYAEDGAGVGLIGTFLDPLLAAGGGIHAKNLYNLYVYFWRWALWKTEDQTPSVVAFITASSFLTGPGFTGMRHALREHFDHLHIIDLGGEGRGARRDDNVFPGVMTPVVIVIGSRYPRATGSRIASTSYRRIRGTRQEKLQALTSLTLRDPEWMPCPNGGSAPLLPESAGRYSTMPALMDLFPWQQSGAKFQRTWPISPSPNLLHMRWADLAASKRSDRNLLLKRSRDRTADQSYRDLRTGDRLSRLVDLTPDEAPTLSRYLYRSFDRQWCVEDNRVGDFLSPSLWRSCSSRQVFLISLLTKPLGLGPAATASSLVPDLDSFRGSYGARHVIPLYRDADGTPNIDPALLVALEGRLEGGRSSGEALGIEDLFAYCFGVLAGTDYTDRFRDELETPGPRIPLTRDRQLFEAMATHGQQLLWLQTFGERFRTKERKALEPDGAVKWTKRPSRIPADSKDLAYNPIEETLYVADGELAGVSRAVWAFEVSGMQVIKKWLGYRTAKGAGKAASSGSPLDKIRPTEWEPEWSEELEEIVHVLTETERLIPTGIKLLDQIMAGDLISAEELPDPPDALRKPPSAASTDDSLNFD